MLLSYRYPHRKDRNRGGKNGTGTSLTNEAEQDRSAALRALTSPWAWPPPRPSSEPPSSCTAPPCPAGPTSAASRPRAAPPWPPPPGSSPPCCSSVMERTSRVPKLHAKAGELRGREHRQSHTKTNYNHLLLVCFKSHRQAGKLTSNKWQVTVQKLLFLMLLYRFFHDAPWHN